MCKVLGIETIKSKKGETFYKVYVGEVVPNCKGYKVRDYFMTWCPDIEPNDDVELVFGAGYDMRAYLKEFKKV